MLGFGFLRLLECFAEDRAVECLTHFPSRTAKTIKLHGFLFCQHFTSFFSFFLLSMSLLSLSIRCHYFMSVSHGIRATSHCSCYFGSNNEIGSSVFTCVKSALTFASLGGAGQTPTLWFSFRRNLINMPRRVTFLI